MMRYIMLPILSSFHKMILLKPRYLKTTSVQTISNRAVNDAEKVVGYPTSFLSLRWLLNDEVANVALHLRKLIGTNHPLLITARDLILNEQTPAWGLIVLLMSKAGGLSRKFSKSDCDITAGILHSQRVLAEITEMVRTGNIIHKSILNVSSTENDLNDLYFGNKLALLTGDYLLSDSFRELAGLKCHEVNELISTCLRDLVEAEFMEPRDKQNRPVLARPLPEQKEITVPNHFDEDVLKTSEILGNTKAEWTLRNLLGGASLLAKCCQGYFFQGTLILAEHPTPFQNLGYLFGRNIALALQANNDFSIFNPGRTGSFSLICGPLMFHLQYDPTFYDELLRSVNNDEVDYERIRNIVKNGPGLKKTIELRDEFSENALKVLNKFPETDARIALINIIKAM